MQLIQINTEHDDEGFEALSHIVHEMQVLFEQYYCLSLKIIRISYKKLVKYLRKFTTHITVVYVIPVL